MGSSSPVSFCAWGCGCLNQEPPARPLWTGLVQGDPRAQSAWPEARGPSHLGGSLSRDVFLENRSGDALRCPPPSGRGWGWGGRHSSWEKSPGVCGSPAAGQEGAVTGLSERP